VPARSPIVATLRAGRGRLVWSTFTPMESGGIRNTPPRNGTIGELADELAGGELCVVSGELDEDQAAMLSSLPNVGLPPATLRVRNPAAFAELLRQRWLDQKFDDPAALEPVYLSRGA
jgi:tRNA A37 threonylcarbamoyladenosine modification protein TsaB